ncbi:MAG: hypothetical protein KJ749_04300, partial [Planctomycetes bacterium]|nr:hypothetical protein [Planctomycetota bacterium]
MPPDSSPRLQYNAVICRYNEIATKGRNRVQFETLLVAGIRRVLSELGRIRVLRERGRIFLLPPRGRLFFSPEDGDVLRTRMPNVMGLASASPGFLVPPELAPIEAVITQTFPEVCRMVSQRIAEPQSIRYRMRARRDNKSFPLTSTQLEVYFAELLLPQFPRLRVDLQAADLSVQIEVRKQRAFVSYEHIAGPGGLPSGVSGHVLALLSGGIDSPVACYQLLKRGCTLDFVTFHSSPYTPPELIAKVARLVRLLNRFQDGGRLVVVNL